jgi:hypothetical protein
MGAPEPALSLPKDLAFETWETTIPTIPPAAGYSPAPRSFSKKRCT